MTHEIKIPTQGVQKEELLEQMQEFRDQDAKWKDGRTWCLVYYAGNEHYELIKKAHNLFFSENALNPLAFQSLKRMESEVVRMSADLLHGGPEAVGTMTSGGTESILLAVKTYRDRARKLKPWILRPEIVAPKTLHVAFDKAGHYFGVKMRYVDIGPDFRVDLKAMGKAIGRNTIAIAASAPQYPHGAIDPIEEISALALKHKLPFHVDACVGGFLLPWIEKLGYPIPPFDFRVPGVTSMSADIHKYGFSAKGASVILYRNMDYLKHQFYVSTNWPGGIYASPGIPGTRPGGPIAAAWAALRGLGEEGYLEITKRAMETTEKLKEGIRSTPDLEILGDPPATLVSFRAINDVDTYAVADQLQQKGWSFDRQQSPASIHLTVNAHNADTVDELLKDMREAVAHVKAHPELASEGDAAMYGMMAKVPIRGIVKHSVLKIMEGMYSPDGQIPDLSKIGDGEDDNMLFKLIDKYGDQAMDILGKIEESRDKLKGILRR